MEAETLESYFTFEGLDLGREVSLIYLFNKRLNKFLFYLRGDNNSIPEPNKWSIFGGVVEYGETKEHCLSRELGEELSIPVLNIKYLGEMTNRKHQRLHFFRGEVEEMDLEKITITEGQRINYFDPHEIEGDAKFETSVIAFYEKNRGMILG